MLFKEEEKIEKCASLVLYFLPAEEKNKYLIVVIFIELFVTLFVYNLHTKFTLKFCNYVIMLIFR